MRDIRRGTQEGSVVGIMDIVAAQIRPWQVQEGQLLCENLLMFENVHSSLNLSINISKSNIRFLLGLNARLLLK